jgi:hypothetical protein
MTKSQPASTSDLMWGAQAISNYIGRHVRSVYYLIDKGVLPVRKLGPRTIVARASEIDRALLTGNTNSRRSRNQRPPLDKKPTRSARASK